MGCFRLNFASGRRLDGQERAFLAFGGLRKASLPVQTTRTGLVEDQPEGGENPVDRRAVRRVVDLDVVLDNIIDHEDGS